MLWSVQIRMVCVLDELALLSEEMAWSESDEGSRAAVGFDVCDG